MMSPASPTASSRKAAAFLRRVRHSAVAWSWVFNGLRLASGLILLPLVLNLLPTPELGMYYVLLSLVALVPLVDFGFGPTIGRFVSYAMGGANSIQAQGIARAGLSSSPNYALLRDLLHTTQTLYRILALVLFVVLGVWGTYVVELRVNETASPLLTRIAWGATLVSAIFEIYSYWWAMYLRNMNEVLAATHIAVIALMTKLIVAAALLLTGAGLLSLPIGSCFGSLIQRHFAKRAVYRFLGSHPQSRKNDIGQNLRILWPNTWRTGVQFFSGYLTINANTAICLHVLGLTANAQYGLSIQLVTFVSGMAAVWISVRWPMFGQLRARHDSLGVQKLLHPRLWLQNATFLAACAGLLLAGPFLLSAFGGGKQVVPLGWLALMMLNGFFETQFNVWGTLLSTENRLPYLWPTVATNVLSLVFSLALIHLTSLGLGALVLGPLLAGSLFNYWYWPHFAARSLGTSLFRFLFKGPETPAMACHGNATTGNC